MYCAILSTTGLLIHDDIATNLKISQQTLRTRVSLWCISLQHENRFVRCGIIYILFCTLRWHFYEQLGRKKEEDVCLFSALGPRSLLLVESGLHFYLWCICLFLFCFVLFCFVLLLFVLFALSCFVSYAMYYLLCTIFTSH